MAANRKNKNAIMSMMVLIALRACVVEYTIKLLSFVHHLPILWFNATFYASRVLQHNSVSHAIYRYSTRTYNTFKRSGIPGPKPYPIIGTTMNNLGDVSIHDIYLVSLEMLHKCSKK